MPDNFKNIALAGALALAIGYCAGYYTKAQFVKADQLDTVTKAQEQTAANIQESLKASTAVEQQVTASNQKVGDIRKEVASRVKQKEKEIVYVEKKVPVPVADVCALDAGTVGLLNDARAGAAANPAGSSDGKSKAAADVEFSEFIDNDLQVVEQYHELATRHNALVDYVQSIVQQQAGK